MTRQLLEMLNYLACLAASAIFIVLLLRRRELLVKPSIQILFYTHVFLQWPLAARQELVDRTLPFPADAYLLIHGCVLIGLAVSVTTWRRQAWDVYSRITNTGASYVDQAAPYIAALLGLCALAAVIHVHAVPLSKLGLFVAFTDPDLAAAAREESFKLVNSPLVRYGFSLQTSTFAPMSAVLIYGVLERAMRRQQIVSALLCTIILLAIVMIVSITGARMFAALIFFSIIVAVLLRRGFVLNPVWIFVAAGIVVLPAALLTLVRQGMVSDVALVPAYIWDLLERRVFGTPLEIGLSYMHHEQIFGDFGIHGIPRIADTFGFPSVNVPNYIGLMYIDSPLISISANGGYMFSYYACFGMIALPICLLALWGLDFLLLILVRLDTQLLLPALAAMAAAGLSFMQSDFTVTLVSHGYGLIPIVAFALVLTRRSLVGRESVKHVVGGAS